MHWSSSLLHGNRLIVQVRCSAYISKRMLELCGAHRCTAYCCFSIRTKLQFFPLLHCLQKRHEVVLDQTVVQGWRDLWLLFPLLVNPPPGCHLPLRCMAFCSQIFSFQFCNFFNQILDLVCAWLARLSMKLTPWNIRVKSFQFLPEGSTGETESRNHSLHVLCAASRKNIIHTRDRRLSW